MPSRMNVICQPTARIRYPVTAAIHVTVTGLPRMRIALARERSALGEPIGEQDEHRRQDEAFGDAQQQAVDNQQPVDADDAGQARRGCPS